MFFNTPRLEIYPERITSNAQTVIKACHDHGAKVACVTKVTCAHPAMVSAYERGGADMIADSRIMNLMSLADTGSPLPLMLLLIPAPSRVADVVRCADVTLNSSLQTLKLLSEAAEFLHKRHQVIVMVDVGDLREGVWPDRAIELVKGAARLPGIDVIGLGCNLACYGGVIPSVSNMNALIAIRDACRKATGLELATLSGGNSSSLPLLAAGLMPKEINHFRLGEAIALGRNVLDRSPWPGTRQDTFRLVAEVVEIERKPSVPIGDRGQNAFGEIVEIKDRGIRLRAICDLGRQDVAIDGLTPEDEGVIVVGGSSDHLIIDVEEARSKVEVGQEIAFSPNYAAVLALFTSHYVQKVVMPG